jgi:hypothetical protein
LVLWLVSLMSRAEPARFLNEPARAWSSRAELARYPPLSVSLGEVVGALDGERHLYGVVLLEVVRGGVDSLHHR